MQPGYKNYRIKSQSQSCGSSSSQQPQSDKMCCENIFADDNFNLEWRVCTLYFCRIFHQFDNLTISKSKIKVANSFQNIMIKWSLAMRCSAVVSFPESLRDFFSQNVCKYLDSGHFICQVEIKFYSRSVKYNLSFPHQFSSFNFLTYSSGICTSNTLKSQINCDLKTYINLVTDSLKGFLRVFLGK